MKMSIADYMSAIENGSKKQQLEAKVAEAHKLLSEISKLSNELGVSTPEILSPLGSRCFLVSQSDMPTNSRGKPFSVASTVRSTFNDAKSDAAVLASIWVGKFPTIMRSGNGFIAAID